MLPKNKTVPAAVASKSFFSEKFEIFLTFGSNGKLAGKISQFPKEAGITDEFEGIYLIEGDRTKIAFIIQSNNSNLDQDVMSGFSGEIIRWDSETDFLILTWLLNCQSIMPKISYIENYVEVLHNHRNLIRRTTLKGEWKTFEGMGSSTI